MAPKNATTQPTVYAAYGNKTGLVRAVADAADLSADASRMLAELRRRGRAPPGSSPRWPATTGGCSSARAT
ncbi:hypothetical protein ACFZCY_25990 [Streptomyces sp. NPDC007983]|uniref:hypothetical protein n=1 Tax=Streptomyces sp. NPDC007983 TaxID=3364800 RepID=UPI0036E95753